VSKIAEIGKKWSRLNFFTGSGDLAAPRTVMSDSR
jgi:hypothetical protein